MQENPLKKFVFEDGDDIDYKDIEIGFQNDENLNDSIGKTIYRASAVLDKEEEKSLSCLVLDFRDIFRTRLGNDPPVDVLPMI